MAPRYEYECEAGHHFEIEQPITDKPLAKCSEPAWGCSLTGDICGFPVKRLITKTSFHLKGFGWAKDGYSSNEEKKKK